MRVDPALSVSAALAFGAVGAVAAPATLVAGAVCSLVLSRCLSRAACFAICAGLAAGWARASWVLASFDAERAWARSFSGGSSRCALRGEVVTSPTWRRGNMGFDVELAELDCEGRIERRPHRARLYANPTLLARGDRVEAVADLGPTSFFRNFDLPDPRPAAARREVVLSGGALALDVLERSRTLPALIDQARAHVRDRIEATFSMRVKAMARALVLGENDLDDADSLAFRKSGLSHLLAVSGTHLIFAVLGVVQALRAVLLRIEPIAARWDVRRPAAAVGMVLAPAYADFAGGSGSAWRAAWMLLAVLGARVLARHVFPSRVIAASLGLGWLSDPLCVFDPSFLLSLAATVGLVCMSRAQGARAMSRCAELAELTRPRPTRAGQLLRRLSDAALTTLAATLPCVPILLLMAPGLTLASVAANILAGPLGEMVALPLCLVHTLLSPLPVLENGVALVASGALAVIRGLAHASASVSWLYVELPPPGRSHIVVLAVAATSWVALGGQPWLGPSRPCSAASVLRRRLCIGISALALLLVEASIRLDHAGPRGRRLRVTLLDVGQGDAALVDLPDGRLMLVDAGGIAGSAVDPGELVVVPALRARRRSRLDIVVLTHPHPDHFGGLTSVARQIEILELWHGGEASPASVRSGAGRGALEQLLHELERGGVKLRTARDLCGADHGRAGYSLRVLGPCPDVEPRQSANDNSLVLKIGLGAHAALLTGDAERWAEARLLDLGRAELRSDFLKVGHHGSRSSSSPSFIAAVSPRLAAISCGIRNRFGHPHFETLQTLADAGAATARLDTDGAVQWETDGQRQGHRVWADEAGSEAGFVLFQTRTPR